MSNKEENQKIYNEEYYNTSCGVRYEHSEHWMNFFGGIADRIIKDLNPKVVLDAGCAKGFLVEALRDRGVEAYGIDISEYAISQVREDIKPYCKVGSILEPFDRQYDLIINMEVIEHITKEEGILAIKNMCEHTQQIIFTSTPTDYKEATHLNVQPTEYWVSQFFDYGFVRDIDYDASYITNHAIYFTKSFGRIQNIIKGYERKFYSTFNENVELRRELLDTKTQLNHYIQEIEPLQKTNEEYKEIYEKTQEYIAHINGVVEKEQQTNELLKQVSINKDEINELFSKLYEDKIEREEIEKVLEEICKIGLKEEEVEQILKEIYKVSLKEEEVEKLIDRKIEKILTQVEQKVEKTNEPILEHIKNNELYIEKYKEALGAYEEASSINQQLSEILNHKEAYVNHLLGVINIMESTKGWRMLNKFRVMKKALIPTKRRAKQLLNANKKVYSSLRRNGLKVTLRKIQQKLQNTDNKTYAVTQEVEQKRNILNLEVYKKEIENFNYKPLISIVVPVYNTPTNVLKEMIESVIRQVYENWELCIVNASKDNQTLCKCLEEYEDDKRIKIIEIEKNEGISINTNVGVKQSTGEFIALLDHDDCIVENALYEIVKQLQKDEYDFFYSDKDMMNEEGTQFFNPLYKPNWSPEIMYSANYLTHFCVIRKEIIEQVGGFDADTDGAQDWDMFIKVTEVTDRICFIPKVLYHWRQLATSVASGIDAKPYALDAQIRTLNNHFKRKSILATASFYDKKISKIKVDFTIPKMFKVSIVINHIGSQEQLDGMLECIRLDSSKIQKEIIIVHSQKVRMDTDENIIYKKIDNNNNYAIAYNTGLNEATGEAIIFTNSQVTLNENTIFELAQWTLYSEIGVVGPKFLGKDNKISNIGLVLNQESILLMYNGAIDPTYNILGYTDWYRNVSAVSSQCFAIRKSVLDRVGRFDEELDDYAQLELCLKVRQNKLRNMYTPYAQVTILNEIEDNLTADSDEYLNLINKYSINEVDEYWNVNLSLNQNIPTLRESEKQNIVGTQQVVEKKPGVWDLYSIDAKVLAEWFDFSSEELEQNNKLLANAEAMKIKTVNWFLPDFDYAFYAGLYTIFRYASYMTTNKGVHNNFIIVGDTDTKRIKKEICRAFSNLANSKVYCVQTSDKLSKVPYADATIATLWTTAYFVLKFNNTRKKFYFMQDYEPLFYPAGATYAQAEASYRFGFFGLTNTVGLSKIYQEQYNGKSEYLVPCVDSSIFYPKQETTSNKYRVFFYGRPGHPRNGFELGTVALRKLKEKLGDTVEIITAGSDWNAREYGVEGIIHNAGRLKYEETGDLYRSCDVGLVLMFTKHPSYLPFELMACGTTVVSNYNPSTTWFLKDGYNCVLTDASATRIAESIITILKDKDRREQIEKQAVKDMIEMHTDWNTQLDKLFEYMEKIS